jgi:hypothetical protein
VPAVQPAQDDAPPEPMRLLAAPFSPPLLNPNDDICRCTFVELHLGQLTDSSLLKTSFSKDSQQSQHTNSKIGIFFLPVEWRSNRPSAGKAAIPYVPMNIDLLKFCQESF